MMEEAPSLARRKDVGEVKNPIADGGLEYSTGCGLEADRDRDRDLRGVVGRRLEME